MRSSEDIACSLRNIAEALSLSPTEKALLANLVQTINISVTTLYQGVGPERHLVTYVTDYTRLRATTGQIDVPAREWLAQMPVGVAS